MTTREQIENFTREEGLALFNKKMTDKEVYDFLVSKGLTDSYETFENESKKIFNEKFSKMSAEEILKEIEGAELSEEQLEMIAGGKGGGETAGMVIGGVGTVVVAIAAASYL